jgi:hypothetical protein
MLRKIKGKWYVLSKEGKRLSKGYNTKKEAMKRLIQIEYYKHKKGKK